MIGKGDSYKRKTKIKRDKGSSGDEGGQYHEKTTIKQKRKHARGNNPMVGTTVMQPTTLTGTGTRGRRHHSSSSSSSQQRRRQAPISTGYPTSGIGNTGYSTTGYGTTGYGTTGYNQTYAPTTMTSGTTGQHLDSFNQTTTTKKTHPGFVEKIKYKLRSKKH